jgi:hypothetical protein
LLSSRIGGKSQYIERLLACQHATNGIAGVHPERARAYTDHMP